MELPTVLPLLADAPPSVATITGVFRQAVPEMVLIAAACALFLGGTFRAGRHLWGTVALASLAVAALLAWTGGPLASPQTEPTAVLAADHLASFTRAVALVGGAVLLLLSWNEVGDDQAAEFHACLLILTAGVSLVGAATELVTMFLSLELISIPTYVMLYLPKTGLRAQEAAIKYFLLSVFSSALLLFGFSYLYGVSGTTNIHTILNPQTIDSIPSGLTIVALIMIIAGLGFRITAVPFHFYAPDVFTGAPTGVAALLAFVPKVAGFTALIRLLGLAGGSAGPEIVTGAQIPLLLLILSAITMTVGNVLGLLQDNVKRMLAYSSVAHGGYMLMGLTVAPDLIRHAADRTLPSGSGAVLFYLLAYGAMTVGAFAVLAYLDSPERRVESVDDLAGLARSHPLLALAMALFLFSLIGLPLTAGFAGKLNLFVGALSFQGATPDERRYVVLLAVVGALNAAIGAYYYLRIVAAMYLRTAIRPLPAKFSLPVAATVAVCAALTLGMGVFPLPFVNAARSAATAQR